MTIAERLRRARQKIQRDMDITPRPVPTSPPRTATDWVSHCRHPMTQVLVRLLRGK